MVFFQYSRRFYVDFDFFLDNVVACKHDGTTVPAHKARAELQAWTRRVLKHFKGAAKVKGSVLRFDRPVQTRGIAHDLNLAMAASTLPDYDMGANRTPFARVYALKDGLDQPEFGDPFVNTAHGWEDASAPDLAALTAELDLEYARRTDAEARVARLELALAELASARPAKRKGIIGVRRFLPLVQR